MRLMHLGALLPLLGSIACAAPVDEGADDGEMMGPNDPGMENPGNTNDPQGPSDPTTNPVDPPTDPVDPPIDPVDPPIDPIDPPDPEINWKAVLMTGDSSIVAFDNAREAVKSALETEGIADENTIQLSHDSAMQVGGVRATSEANLEQAFVDLNLQEGDGCFLHMTSHGSRSGFALVGQGTLTPLELDTILDNTCGDLPTVVLVSACYSGTNIKSDLMLPSLRGPNRVVLTAAREDRTSFGCSAEAVYTYWDGCLLDNFDAATTWEDLHDRLVVCIEEKESRGTFTPSHPQAFFGDDMQNMSIFYR